jgi:hypothetical protein
MSIFSFGWADPSFTGQDDYIQMKEQVGAGSFGPPIRGNWTCEESLWWSADDDTRFIIW